MPSVVLSRHHLATALQINLPIAGIVKDDGLEGRQADPNNDLTITSRSGPRIEQPNWIRKLSILDEIFAAATKAQRKIVLSEGNDDRIATAAVRAANDGLCEIVLVGRPPSGVSIPGAIEVIQPQRFERYPEFVDTYAELRKHKGVTLEKARADMASPLGFSAMMVRLGLADGTVGGAVHTTADTVRAALQIIGRAPGAESVSSFFLMILPGDPKRVAIFSDCALVSSPNAEQLARIALASRNSFELLTGETARVAMLSFSTLGSADTPEVEKVRQATALVRQLDPDILVDGEIQFDAAYHPGVAAKKAAGSPLQGDANVFIFPDLHAGNIGYKIAHRVGGAEAIGPVLQGLASPANDLSRGCSVDDIYAMLAVTAIQAGNG